MLTTLNVQFIDGDESVQNRPFVAVLLHGMWHGNWFWQRLQARLAAAGIASYALELRAGHLKTLQSHVDDVISTMRSLNLSPANRLVLIGHSQGGLICQALLEDPSFCSSFSVNTVILAASVPLAMQPAETFRAWGWFGSPLVRMFFTMGAVPFLYYCVFGRLWNRNTAHALFFLPSTAPSIAALQRCVDAPCDGLPTWAHFMRPKPLFTLLPRTRVLVLGAENDVVYAPGVLIPAFRARFPHCTFHVAPHQAHCLSDPGCEETVDETIVQFISQSDN